MIVSCDSCQTRFRVADEKIGPRGARIRCSRCQAVFVVMPAAAPPMDPPSAPDPFAATSVGSGSSAPRLDPFMPHAAAEPDPFAAGPVSPPLPAAATSDPFAPEPVPSDDPFASAGAPVAEATPRRQDDPRSDPFALDDAPQPVTGSVPLLGSPGDLADLLGDASPPAKGPAPPSGASLDGEALALEERQGPPPARGSGPGASFTIDPLLGQAADAGTPGPSGLEVDLPAPPIAPPPPPPPLARRAPKAPAAADTVRAAPVPPADEGERRRRSLHSLLVNSLSLALLLVVTAGFLALWRGDAAVERGGLARLLAALGRAAPAAPIAARSVASGVYSTEAGGEVLFVRGTVIARQGSSAPVAVRVEALQGDKVVARAEGLVGALPTPEEVWRSNGPADVEALRGRLAPRALPSLAAGQSAPFLVVFAEPPGAPGALAFRVAAEPAAAR